MQKNVFKVLVVSSTFPRWNDDTGPPFVFELCKRLAIHDIDIDVIAPHAPEAEKQENLYGINIYRYSYFFSKWELLAYNGGILANLKKNKYLYLLLPFFITTQFFSIIKKINNKSYDLIHAHWLIPQGVLCVIAALYFSKNKPKVICTLHGGDLFALQSGILNILKKWTLKKLCGITVVSKHMRDTCLNMIDIKDNIYIGSMGVDLKNLFVPDKKVKREKHKLIFVGRLVEKKGVIILLEAVSEIIQTFPDTKLLIVGDGPDKFSLEKKCKFLKLEHHIEFCGAIKQDALPALYSSASIAIMPSVVGSNNDQEGLGLVAIEAMGCGCAVIASALPAVFDVIKDGETGILVEPGDSTILAQSLKSLFLDSEKQQKIAMQGRQSVQDKFDWPTVTQNYMKIYENFK